MGTPPGGDTRNTALDPRWSFLPSIRRSPGEATRKYGAYEVIAQLSQTKRRKRATGRLFCSRRGTEYGLTGHKSGEEVGRTMDGVTEQSLRSSLFAILCRCFCLLRQRLGERQPAESRSDRPRSDQAIRFVSVTGVLYKSTWSTYSSRLALRIAK